MPDLKARETPTELPRDLFRFTSTDKEEGRGGAGTDLSATIDSRWGGPAKQLGSHLEARTFIQGLALGEIQWSTQ